MPSVPIDGGGNGDNILVPAVTGKAIRLTSLAVISSSLMGIRIAGGALGTGSGTTTSGSANPLTGQMELAAFTPLVLPYSEAGWCQTAEDEYLNIIGYRSGTFSGVLTYEEVNIT